MKKVNTRDIKRAWMISDIHFGVRSSSLEWINIHKDYFNKFFIPLITKNKKEGDCLFVLGDIFESRQSLNVLVINEAFEIFNKLSSIMPVIIIVGNHDTYRKQSNDVNSSIIFNSIKNIEVLTEPRYIDVCNAKLFMMPWVENKTNEIDIIRKHPADYMFCHTDFMNMKYNKKIAIEHGLNPDIVKDYKKVYSGHIHYTQTVENIRMIGCPLQLTRGDMYNQKYVYMLDFETGEESRYDNDFSPVFLKFKIEDILETPIANIKRYVQNNFVDFIVDGGWIAKFPFALFSDSIDGHRKINYVLSSLQKDYEDEEYDGEEINLEDLINVYVNNLPYTDKTKEKLLKVSLDLYRKAIKMLQEKEL